tara:strand:- start:4977 stop:5600 length:624 start_codon:yes stop_codon:yes gene_type:complete
MNEVTSNHTSTDVMSADITKLVEAQMKLTDEFSKIKKDSQGQFKYTSMDYLLPKIKPIMKKHGITFMQAPIGNDGMIGVKTIWMHKSGQYIISNVSVPIDTNTRVSSYQSAGQAITYLRRYALLSHLNLASSSDDDGALAPPKLKDEQVKTLKSLQEKIQELYNNNGMSASDYTDLLKRKLPSIKEDPSIFNEVVKEIENVIKKRSK